jgi:hypothetical protein
MGDEIAYAGNMNDIRTERDGKGRFITGGKPGPGRPRGSRNRHTENFFAAFADDFERHGAKVIERVRVEKPDAYLRVAADLLPRNLDVSTTLDIGVDAANFIESFRHAVSLLGNQMPRLPKVRVVDAD